MTTPQMYRQPYRNLPTTPNEIASFISLISHRMSEVCSAPPLQELLNTGQKKGILEAIISLLIIKASNRLSVGGNLRPGQADEIAQQIVIDYPLLSIDDINLLLLNGTKGKYGEIYRMDISVIYDWIRAYEGEKAEFIEQNIVKEHKTEKALPQAEFDPATSEMVQEYLNKLAMAGGMSRVPSVSKEELHDNNKPKSKSAGIPYGTKEENERRDLKVIWARENTDLYTGRLIPGAIDFITWLKLKK